MATLPVNWKNCATCARWCGRQIPDVFNNYVEYDSDERAKCAGGLYNQLKMSGLSSCPQWTQRFK